MSTGRRFRFGLREVLALFALFAALHATLLPLFEGPDEPDNLRYVRFLVEEGRLTRPVLEPTWELENNGRGHMPPLWFLSMAPVFSFLGADEWQISGRLEPDFYRRVPASTPEEVRAVLDAPASRLNFEHGLDERSAFRGAGLDVRVMRFLTIPWALLVLWATYHAALRATGDDNRALWIAALGASIPQFQSLSGTITMDVMLAAWGALTLYACVEWCSGPGQPGRWAALAGACAGLAAFTKLNGMVLAPTCLVAAVLAWRRGRGFLGPLVVSALAFLLVAGPWYAWGFLETGHPLWTWAYQQVSPFHQAGGGPGVLDADGTALFALFLFLTWLADFGWVAVWFPLWVVAPVFTMYAVGVGRATAAGLGGGSRARAAAARVLGFALVGAALLAVARWTDVGPRRFGESQASATAGIALSAAFALLALVASLRRRADAADPADDRASAALDVAPDERRAALGFLLVASALILAAQTYFYTQSSQMQARHAYPFFTAIVVVAGAGLARLRLLRICVLTQVVLSVAAFPWLLGRMRYDGWSSDPLIAATDFHRRLDPALTDDRGAPAEVEWLQPGPNAAFPADEPPTLVWKIDGTSEYDVAVSGRPSMHRQPWRPDGWVHRAIPTFGVAPRGSLELPPDFWEGLRAGSSVYVQVVRLGEDGEATGHSTVREIRRAP